MKKTTKVVWMAMAITAFSFNLSATDMTLKEAQALYKKGDYEKAIPIIMAEAEKGDAVAQFGLGLSYARGNGVTQDYKLAEEWYTKSANQGFSASQYNLALLYYYGQGVEKDYAKAKEWFSKAAEQGDKESKENLELIKKKEQPAPKTINWEVLENDSRVEIQYQVNNISIRVAYQSASQEIRSILLYYHDGDELKPLTAPEKEIKNRFKTMKELNSFLLKHHNQFFYVLNELETVQVIRRNAPTRKTITF